MAIYVTGDVHGDAFELAARADAVGAGKGDDILVLGDVGLMYGHRDGLPVVSGWMAQLMRHEGWRLVVMRGNHDVRYGRDLLARSMADRVGFGGAYRITWCGGPAFVCDCFPNIVFLPDAGGFYDICGAPTLVVPGAYSVDKGLRLAQGLPWEEQEQLTDSEMTRLLDIARYNEVACVLSHTCPKEWQPWMGDLLLEKATADDSMERWMNALLWEVQPALRRWAFGHYHADRSVGFGTGRLMFREIAEFGSLVRGDATGAARPDCADGELLGGSNRALYRVLGGAPAGRWGYTEPELAALLGCTADDVERALAGRAMAVDRQTGEPTVVYGDISQVVYDVWNRRG